MSAPEQAETLAAFIARFKVTMDAFPISERPDRVRDENDADTWGNGASHFRIVIKRGRKKLETFYSQGSGHHGETPDIATVLDCLISDAESWDNARKVTTEPDGTRTLGEPDIETFASEMGYDDPGERHYPPRPRPSFIARYRACERAFNACGETFRTLRTMFGAKGFDELRACERL